MRSLVDDTRARYRLTSGERHLLTTSSCPTEFARGAIFKAFWDLVANVARALHVGIVPARAHPWARAPVAGRRPGSPTRRSPKPRTPRSRAPGGRSPRG